MINEVDTLLNALMVEHHHWSSRAHVGTGYPKSSASCREARASRQYDDFSGALDAALDDSRMEAFDASLYRIPQPYLTALQVQARNMATGASVWRSPRLPDDPMERAVLTLEARNKLLRELNKSGVVS